MRRVWVLLILIALAALVLILYPNGGPMAQTEEDHVANAREMIEAAKDVLDSAIAELDAISEPPPDPDPDPEPEDIPPTADLQPQRTPLNSVSDRSAQDPFARFYEIDVLNADQRPGGVLLRQRFMVAEGWEFYDRYHYSCVTTYLQAPDGTRLAQVVYRRADGVPGAYAQLNDKHGNEHQLENDGIPSACALETENDPMTEVEEKPEGLADTIIRFLVDGEEQTQLICPATSERDAETWCEYDEETRTANHVQVEIYWQEDMIVQIDIDRMSPRLQIATG